jgi:hypothetical protein
VLLVVVNAGVLEGATGRLNEISYLTSTPATTGALIS